MEVPRGRQTPPERGQAPDQSANGRKSPPLQAPGRADAGQAAQQLSAARVGYAYHEGTGVLQDFAEAVRWFRLAAQQGNAEGQAGLGAAYALGQGVLQDYVSAHMWLNLAVAGGEERAREARDSVAELMTRAQIAEAQRRAREWNAP